MSLMLSGTGVSRGIALGVVRLLHDIQPDISETSIPATRVKSEIRRFGAALREAGSQISRLRDDLGSGVPGELRAVLDSHLMMLADEALSRPVETLIREHLHSTEWALALHLDHLKTLFERIDDPYLRERRADVENVIARVLRALQPARKRAGGGAENQPEPYVLVTNELDPTDLMVHHQRGVIAVVAEHGSELAHTTIVARNLGVPMIVRVPAALQMLNEAEMVVVDGSSGMLVAHPDEITIRNYRKTRQAERRELRKLQEIRGVPGLTRDKQRVYLLANIEEASDAKLARKGDADGIGMYRTEALYLNRENLPDEEEQFQLYRSVIKRMRGAPVTVRTMDIWVSRRIPGLEQRLPGAPQPALGLRAIRLCLRYPEIFRPQLRALLRASALGPLRILLPMVSAVAEVTAVAEIIRELKAELRKDGKRFDPKIKTGLMVEVPAAAISCKLFLPHVDFLSIGTNDLIQYTLAIDRNDDAVQPLYDPLHPAVLRLIRDTIRAGRRAEIPVSVCGEMAGDPRLTRLLLGLGLREFSMHPSSLLAVKQMVLNSDAAALERPATQLLNTADPERAAELVARMNND